MGKRNRNKNKKKKESDGSTGTGSTGNVNGGSSSSNNNNDITIPTMDATIGATATTTTILLTTEEIERIDSTMELMGYPKSNDFLIGYRLFTSDQEDPAIASFKRGAEKDGCVPCMCFYGVIQLKRGNLHLVLPWALEGSIRGHITSIHQLIEFYRMQSKPAAAMALSCLWTKIKNELSDTGTSEEERKEIKKNVATICYNCAKEDSKDVTLVKCGICKHYSYCGKNCQTRHWKEYKHMNECRQVILLRKYCKPAYVKEIREAIISGEDPKEIHTLQRLRMKLGLNRPTEEYEELMLRLNNDDDNNNNIILKPGKKVKVKGLVKASVHNGKIGIVTKVSIPGQDHRRVGVELSDDNGGTVVVAIKIENLELSSASASASATMTTTTNNTNRPNPREYLVGKKDGTVHIGSTPNAI